MLRMVAPGFIKLGRPESMRSRRRVKDSSARSTVVVVVAVSRFRRNRGLVTPTFLLLFSSDSLSLDDRLANRGLVMV